MVPGISRAKSSTFFRPVEAGCNLKINNPYINLYKTIIKTNESKIIDTKTEIIFELKGKRIIGRALIIKYYHIMCIITQIAVPIIQKFVFVLTKFCKPGGLGLIHIKAS